MSLTLGRDIGIVMAKGVLLGVICTLTILPALIMTFDGAVHRYTHPTLIPRLAHISKFVAKHYIPILIVFVVLFIPFSIAQSRTPVYYTLFDSLPQDMDSIVGTNRLKEDFNMTTSHFIIVDDSLPSASIKKMSEEIGQVDGVTPVSYTHLDVYKRQEVGRLLRIVRRREARVRQEQIRAIAEQFERAVRVGIAGIDEARAVAGDRDGVGLHWMAHRAEAQRHLADRGLAHRPEIDLPVLEEGANLARRPRRIDVQRTLARIELQRIVQRQHVRHVVVVEMA